ncbi:MAG: hypothetical protein ACLUEV_06125 [Alistipes sp.]
MRERIGQLLSPQATRRIWMGTFHSLFSRIRAPRPTSWAIPLPTRSTTRRTPATWSSRSSAR